MTLPLDGNTARFIHLSASAGSGKTRELTNRYVRLLGKLTALKLGIDQAVAITFTDKAAAEIKDRVLKELPEELLKTIIRGRQDVRISTIHSFCMNLLKRYPLEAGLPPDFGILDERDKSYKVRQAVEEALEGMDRGDLLALQGLSSRELVDAAESLLAVRTGLKRMEIDAGGPKNLLAGLDRGMDTAGASLDLAALPASVGWRDAFQRMETILRQQGAHYDECRGSAHQTLAVAGTVAAARPLAAALTQVYYNKDGTLAKRPFIAKKYFSGKDRQAYEDAYFAVQEMLARFQDLSARLRTGSEAQSLLRIFFRAEERYEDSKLREGLLDFDDLELFAYRLLKEPGAAEILYRLDRKVLHYLIDEFQDTSDIQWAVLNKLTEELFSGMGADKPMPPSLFVVGDGKQSIYRFREANHRLIDNVKQSMEALPADLRSIRTLDRNYRSVPEVIGAVNTVFGALWGVKYAAMDTARQAHRGSVRLIEVPPASAGATAPDEATLLAREVRSLVEAGTRIHEKKKDGSWEERDAGFGDCAILIQTRTRLKEYEAALLSEGVPFRVVGGIGFYEEDEVQAVISVLFALWNRDDQLNLAAALKSPLFGLTDRDLYGLLHEGGSFAAGLRRQRPEIADILEEWKRQAGVLTLSQLIHRIISDTGAYVRFGRRRTQAIFNLDKLLDTAREFDRRGYTTLQDFVERVRGIRESEQREAAADMNLPGDQGAVSIMTVHKAKGLEFPVVFLPGLNQQTKSLKTGPEILVEAEKDGRMRMAGPDRATPLYKEMWEREKAELREEHQRLLYVAMTRACDHLLMTATLSKGTLPGQPPRIAANTWLQYLHTAIPTLDAPAGERGLCFAYPDWSTQTLPDAPARTERNAPAHAEAIDPTAILKNIAACERSGITPWKKATDYLSKEKERTGERPVPHEGQAVSPVTRGSIFHRCLEEYASTGTFALPAIANEFPEFLALGAEERGRFLAGAEQVIRSVTGNEELAWIFKQQPGAYSELPFLYRRRTTSSAASSTA